MTSHLPQRGGSNSPLLANILRFLVYPAVPLAMIFRYWRISKLMKFMIQRSPKKLWKLFRDISTTSVKKRFFDDNVSENEESAMVSGLSSD